MYIICIALLFITALCLYILFYYLWDVKKCLNALKRLDEILKNNNLVITKPDQPDQNPNEVLTLITDLLKQAMDK